MKSTKVILTVVALMLITVFQSCDKDIIDQEPDTSIMPERFMIEIPGSISGNNYAKSTNDTLQGNDIYQHLTSFIWVGAHAAHIVSDIIFVISLYDLSQPMTFTYTGDDDGRNKFVEITENSEFEGTIWEYQMTITDDGPGNSSGAENRAMQIFWNKTPIQGIAILNPYNIDRTTDPSFIETMYRIEYSEVGNLGYDRHMIVTIDDLPVADPLADPFSLKTMKMFVGKSGDEVSIYGNSEHPNAIFINGDVGFDWTFSAASYASTDISVAEVGLPSNTLNASDRYTLLEENSIQNVFAYQIYDVWPGIDSTSVESFLYNTAAPGFFNQNGFIQGGTAPGSQYNGLLSTVAGLTPYNPMDINTLEVIFKP